MTRSSRRNEEARDEMTDDNPDIRMRPSVQKLITTMRKLKILDDYRVVELLIGDIAYQRFVRKPMPLPLWQLANKLVFYWRLSIRDEVARDFGNQRQNILGDFEILSEDEPEKGELTPRQNIEEVHARQEGFSMQARVLLGQKIVPVVDFDDKDLRKRVRVQIMEHYFDEGHAQGANEPGCGCGRRFEFMEEWANHVRSVVWKEMQNVEG